MAKTEQRPHTDGKDCWCNPTVERVPPAGWEYTPSCPCDDCEDHRKANGMTCIYGLGPRPEEERRHHG